MRRFRPPGFLPLAAVAALATACATRGVGRQGRATPVAVLHSSGDRALESAGTRAASHPLLDSLGSLLPSIAAGMVVATVADGEISIASVGDPGFTRETLFEYGSITKVFTAVALAGLVAEGRVDLDAPVTRYLADDLRFPQWDRVMLRSLATHTSGGPPLPPNFGVVRLWFSRRIRDPYASYDRAALARGLERSRIDRDPEWAYSNFGYAILGQALADAAGVGYAQLVVERILRPLRMETATLSGWAPGPVAPPLDRRGRPVDNWTFDVFAPAGALRGTIDDGVAFLRASMEACSPGAGAAAGGLAAANCAAQQPSGVRVSDTAEMGLGWVRTERGGQTAIWHNGGTGGYSSFLGFSPDTARGIVVLANIGGLRGHDSVAIAYLTGTQER